MSEHKPLILVVDDDEFSITVIRSIIKDRWEIITAVSVQMPSPVKWQASSRSDLIGHRYA